MGPPGLEVPLHLADWMCVLQGTVGSSPSGAALLDESTKLKEESEDLKTRAGVVAEALTDELDAVGRLEAEAEQVKCPHIDNGGRGPTLDRKSDLTVSSAGFCSSRRRSL